MSSESTTPAETSSSVFGHVQHTVTLRNEDGSTRTETVMVRELTCEQLELYLVAFLSEPRRIEVVCGKQEGWANMLTRQSHQELVEIDERVNLDFFSRWKARRDRLTAVAIDPNELNMRVEALKLAWVEIMEPLKDVFNLEAQKMLRSGVSSPTPPPSQG